MKTRYNKIIRDVTTPFSKSLMLVLAIAIGVFGIGVILGSYSVIKREMKDNYLSTVPASATIEVDKCLTKEIVDSIKMVEGIEVAERHATLLTRMYVNGKWYPLVLFVIDDFNKKETNKAFYVSGAREPASGAMLVERTAYSLMNAKEGDELIVKFSDGSPQKIKLAGTVHNPASPPAWQEQTGYGYINLSTLQLINKEKGFDQLRILLSEDQYSLERIKKISQSVAQQLNMAGFKVHEIQIPPPNKHPHQSQMDTIMTIFVIFSFLVLILGSILVATTVATLMVKQIRQIGIMKTIGATSTQVSTMFLVMIFLLCLLALIIGIPTSQVAAAGLYNQLAELLNLEIRNSSIPFWVILLQIASGVLIPIIAVSFPIIRGSAITVKAALNNYGTNIQKFKSNALLSKLSRLNCVSETIGLSIRNMFRLQSRLLMTLGLLAAGGAMFMSALNVSKAWEVNLEKLYQQRLYDLEIRLNENIIADSIICKIKSIEGIKGVEGWNFTSISKNKNNSFEISQTYPDKGHGSFTMQALPVPTNILKPNLLAGKWLENNNKNDVVLNQSSKGKHKIGDLVSFKINNLVTDWNVIGFSEDVGSPAIAYVSQGVYSKILNTNGKINMLRISYVDRTKENAILKNQKIETLLEKENISINATIPIWLLRNAIASHIGVLINALLGMAILMAFIGSIGLMSTMSMNVLERTREIGIMRAIGATPNKIKNLIVWEGLFIGILSILFAFGISLFLSSYLGRLIGNLSFRTPLTLSVSYLGLFIWIIIVITGSYLATLIPTKRTNNISAREALAYE